MQPAYYASYASAAISHSASSFGKAKACVRSSWEPAKAVGDPTYQVVAKAEKTFTIQVGQIISVDQPKATPVLARILLQRMLLVAEIPRIRLHLQSSCPIIQPRDY